MNRIKKLVAILVAVFMLVTLSGCAKHGECESCGQNEELREYVDEDGDSYWLCEDCYHLAKLFGI